jgi:ribosomal protein S18 acetylase RimI-like enzyme
MVIGGGYTNSTDHLRKPGCEKLNLQVRDDNASAESFYESLGFILGLIKEPRTSMGKLFV